MDCLNRSLQSLAGLLSITDITVNYPAALDYLWYRDLSTAILTQRDVDWALAVQSGLFETCSFAPQFTRSATKSDPALKDHAQESPGSCAFCDASQLRSKLFIHGKQIWINISQCVPEFLQRGIHTSYKVHKSLPMIQFHTQKQWERAF